MEKGLGEGQTRVLLALITARFGQVTPPIEERVRAASAEERERWAIRVLAADQLDAVFAAG